MAKVRVSYFRTPVTGKFDDVLRFDKAAGEDIRIPLQDYFFAAA
jgi:hypothetical protein